MFYVCHYDEVLLVWYHNLAVSDPFLLAALAPKTLCADHASSESWMPEVCFIWAVINGTCRFTWELPHQFSKHQILGSFLFDFSNWFLQRNWVKSSGFATQIAWVLVVFQISHGIICVYKCNQILLWTFSPPPALKDKCIPKHVCTCEFIDLYTSCHFNPY